METSHIASKMFLVALLTTIVYSFPNGAPLNAYVLRCKAVNDRHFHLILSSIPFLVVLSLSPFPFSPTSLLTRGQHVCLDGRSLYDEKGILMVEVDQSVCSLPQTHLFGPLLLPGREGSVTRTAQPVSLTSGTRVNLQT